MRAPRLALALAATCAAALGCSPALTGAPCNSNDNCPTGQFCSAGRCAEGRGTGSGTSAGAGGTSGSSGSSGCPGAGSAVDTGCPGPGAQLCAGDGHQLLDCENVRGCQLWRPLHDCAGDGLLCAPGAAACTCPAVPTGSNMFFVDNHPVAGGPTPTGVAAPPACAFKTIDAALTEVRNRQLRSATVVLEGAPLPPAWRPRTKYVTGNRVTPNVLDGFAYVATTASGGDLSGATEPAFGLTPAVSDGAITWTRDGPAAPEIFDQEPASSRLPLGVALESAACLLPDAGTPCDPRAYVYATSSPFLDGALLRLGDGSQVEGVTFANVGNVSGGAMLRCDILARGSVRLHEVWLLGNNKAGNAVDDGLLVSGDCSAELATVYAGGFNVSGVHLKGRDLTSKVDMAAVFLGSPGRQNDTGLLLESGTATMDGGRASHNLSYGVHQVPGGDQAELALQWTSITDNGLSGVRIDGNAGRAQDAGSSGVTTLLSGLDVARNNKNRQSENGGLLFAGPSTLAKADALRVHDNGGAQIDFTAAASPDTGTWDLSHPSDTAYNAVYCYDRTLSGAGIHFEGAQGGGPAGSPVVLADEMYWGALPPVQGRDYVQTVINQISATSAIGIYDAGPGGCTGP